MSSLSVTTRKLPKNVMPLAILFILLVGLIFTVLQVQQRQDIRQRASEEPIVCWNFAGGADGDYTWTSGCGGRPYEEGMLCPAFFAPLNATQSAQYEQWVADGSVVLSECAIPSRTAVCKRAGGTCMNILMDVGNYGCDPSTYTGLDLDCGSPALACCTFGPAPSSSSSASFVNTFTVFTKFVGIDQDRGPITAAFQLGSVGSSTPLMAASIGLVGDSDGIYSATFTVSPADLLSIHNQYWITLKGDRHLRRAFGNITLTDGGVLDLTAKPQAPGDLIPQDGQVDSNDIDKILAVLDAPTPITPNHANADVNYDGVVNAFDMGLVLQTLSVRPDEEILP